MRIAASKVCCEESGDIERKSILLQSMLVCGHIAGCRNRPNPESLWHQRGQS